MALESPPKGRLAMGLSMNLNELTRKSELVANPSFEDWLQGRTAQLLSTNFGSESIAFQNWRNFKEAFAPELIGQAFEETSNKLNRKVESCIDPFGGSGTTALASQFLGVSPTTIEVNPFLADLIEAKLCRYDIEQLISDFTLVVDAPIRRVENPLPNLPPSFVEPGVKGRFIFSHEVASVLHVLRGRIFKLGNAANRRLMRVLLGAIALPVSNVSVSGKGRRYRKNWADRFVSGQQVVQDFSDAVIRAIFDIRRYSDRKNTGYRLLRGDSRKLIPNDQQFDMCVFSPPYPNSFDYTDVYNVELWLCEYLKDFKENRDLRMETLRSHVQVARGFEAGDLRSSTLDDVYAQLSDIRNSLWSRNIPDMVRAYFDDMNTILSRLHSQIVRGGNVYMVVGDSQYSGVPVPVARILEELSTSIGFQVKGAEPFRSMRASPQQGGRKELLETLVTLSR